MTRTKIFAFLMALLMAPTLFAQPRRDRDWEDRRGRVSAIISDCERRTDDFKVILRRTLDRSPLDGTRREDELNRSAAVLEKAMNRLKESWNLDRDFDRSRRHLAVALDAGRDLNRTLSRHRLRSHIQREWDVVKSELNRLAEVFREPRIRWD